MTHIGKYEILEELGRGGFATVYKARDTILGRVVALKVLAGDAEFIARFKQEVRAVAVLEQAHRQFQAVYCNRFLLNTAWRSAGAGAAAAGVAGAVGGGAA